MINTDDGYGGTLSRKCAEQMAREGKPLPASNCSAANMVPVESLRPLIKAIGVLLGCQHITVEDNERAIEINRAFNSALQKVREESIAVAHLIYESTKQQNAPGERPATDTE